MFNLLNNYWQNYHWGFFSITISIFLVILLVLTLIYFFSKWFFEVVVFPILWLLGIKKSYPLCVDFFSRVGALIKEIFTSFFIIFSMILLGFGYVMNIIYIPFFTVLILVLFFVIDPCFRTFASLILFEIFFIYPLYKMRKIKAFGLLLFIFSYQAYPQDLPSWAIEGQSKTIEGVNIVCSGDDKDPEVANSKARNNCLVSAMKLSGVGLKNTEQLNSTLNETKFESNTTADELQGVVKCDFRKRFLQSIENDSRVWLQCFVANKNIIKFVTKKHNDEVMYGPKKIFDQLDSAQVKNKEMKTTINDLYNEIDKNKNELESIKAENIANEKKIAKLTKEKEFYINEYNKQIENNPVDRSYNKIKDREKIVISSIYRGMPLNVLEELFNEKIRPTVTSDTGCYRAYKTFTMAYVGKIDLCLGGGGYGNYVVLGYCLQNGKCYTRH